MTDDIFCLQGLAVAVSGDVYTAKAVIAARTPGAGGVGDGAGIMFAEGLYRNALRMIGTPRPPASTADDDDAAAGGVGDGAGIMFAEGLYRNALRMIGTPRHPRRRRRHPPSPRVARLEQISGSPPR